MDHLDTPLYTCIHFPSTFYPLLKTNIAQESQKWGNEKRGQMYYYEVLPGGRRYIAFIFVCTSLPGTSQETNKL